MPSPPILFQIYHLGGKTHPKSTHLMKYIPLKNDHKKTFSFPFQHVYYNSQKWHEDNNCHHKQVEHWKKKQKKKIFFKGPQINRQHIYFDSKFIFEIAICLYTFLQDICGEVTNQNRHIC